MPARDGEVENIRVVWYLNPDGTLGSLYAHPGAAPDPGAVLTRVGDAIRIRLKTYEGESD